MIEFKPYTSEYKEQVLKLLEPLWGNWDMKKRSEYFEWKYLNNPLCKEPLIFLAMDVSKNKVVGFRGYFILPYSVKNNFKKIAVFSDAFINPLYRRRGIFQELTSFSLKYIEYNHDIDYFFATSSAMPTTQAYLKLGSIPLGEKKVLYKPIFFKCLKKKLKYKVVIKDEIIIDDIQKIYSQCIERKLISLVRDYKFINWRYLNPNAKYYFMYLYENEKPVGFLSYFFLTKRRVFVLDILYKDTKVLKEMMIAINKIKHLRLIQMWAVPFKSEDLSALQRLGFRCFKKILGLLNRDHYQPILLKSSKADGIQNDLEVNGVNFKEIENWDINLICSDGV